MSAWSAMELFQFGPLGSKVVDPYHGRGLRSFVHPWPQTSRCEVEKQVATKEWKAGITGVLPSGRGLFAIEYLLFYPGVDTACLPGSPAGQTWSALSPDALAKAKGEYAAAVSANVLALALEIDNVWRPTGEDFKSKLAAAKGYGDEQEALNVIGWSLFYVHQELKSFKLAPRAGITATPPNPETPFAEVEIENIRTNLRAFRGLFQGCGEGGAGLGFDDWLVAVGQAPLASDIVAALGAAQTAAGATPSFAKASQAEVLALHAAVKVLSDLLKTNLFGSASPLNLKLPATVASDTD
jgi:predicted lipoprotein